MRKAEREIAEYRKFQELNRSFVEINERICHLGPVEQEPQSTQEKKRLKRSAKKSRAK